MDDVVLEALDGESRVLIEGFIEGKEFSCIVIQHHNTDAFENGREDVIALPPTEIRKGKELFDYRSKYLPGLSRKITWILLFPAGIWNSWKVSSVSLTQIISSTPGRFFRMSYNRKSRFAGTF